MQKIAGRLEEIFLNHHVIHFPMKATFAAGCFWGVEYDFSQVPGVKSTVVGYIGGDEKKYPKPSYEEVCTNKAGYAEAVQIEFDPKKVTYEKLLGIFWKIHDPTTVNRQGPDIGAQYRSAVFYHTEVQKKAALESLKKQEQIIGRKIATQIVPATTFFRAEDYHQKYAEKHGGAVCHI